MSETTLYKGCNVRGTVIIVRGRTLPHQMHKMARRYCMLACTAVSRLLAKYSESREPFTVNGDVGNCTELSTESEPCQVKGKASVFARA